MYTHRFPQARIEMPLDARCISHICKHSKVGNSFSSVHDVCLIQAWIHVVRVGAQMMICAFKAAELGRANPWADLKFISNLEGVCCTVFMHDHQIAQTSQSLQDQLPEPVLRT
jgi:hypothetical protein